MTNDLSEIIKLGPGHSQVASPDKRSYANPTVSSLPAKSFLGSLQDAGTILFWCPQKLVLRELEVPQGGEKRAICTCRVLPRVL